MYKPIKDMFFKYLFPSHIGAQLVFLSICVMTSVLMIQVYENTAEYIEDSVNNSVSQGKILARNIAATSTPLLYENDFAAIEDILIQSSAYPNISSIQVTNQHGMIISNVRKNNEGKTEVFFKQAIITPPSEGYENIVAEEKDIYIWEQIANGLGWVRVNYSIADIKSSKAEQITHAMIEAFIIVIVTAALLVLFLRKPIATLNNIAKFSASIGENNGARLKDTLPSVEIQNIVNSLNRVSEKLYKQNHASNEEIDELKAYKFSTDQHSIVSITKANGRILYVNNNFCRISGYKEEGLINQNHCLLSSGIHPKEFFKDMWQTILNGDVWQGEICNKNRNGKLYWVKNTIVPILDDKGESYQFISIGNDITEERHYRTTLEQLSAFPQHNPHVTISIDASGEMMYTNMAAVKLMVQLALAHKSVQRMLPEDIMAFIQASLQSDTVIRDIEVEVLDMKWLWAIQPLPEQNIVLCYAVDISASKALMHKQRDAYQQLEQKYEQLKASLGQGTHGKETVDIPLSKSSTKT